MATVAISAKEVVVELSTMEKIGGLHGDVHIARSHVTGVEAVDKPMQHVRGLRFPGTAVPGLVLIGTYISSGNKTFAVCHGRGPGVVMQVTDEAFDTVVVSVDDPESVVSQLSS